MKRFLAPLLLISLPLLAGKIVVELPGGSGGTDEELTYFNGTPYWLTWGGMYRGTWFNIQDFMPGSTEFSLGEVEYWFYESTNTDPWDTDQFYSEVWNGGQTSPEVLLAQDVVTALHYSPCYHEAYVWVDQNFWCIVNTEMSAGGWPSILSDNSMPGDAGHSFFSDDFTIWESWGDYGEFYTVARWGYINSLKSTTWGSLKALF